MLGQGGDEAAAGAKQLFPELLGMSTAEEHPRPRSMSFEPAAQEHGVTKRFTGSVHNVLRQDNAGGEFHLLVNSTPQPRTGAVRRTAAGQFVFLTRPDAGNEHRFRVGHENRYDPGVLADLGHENRYHDGDKEKNQVIVDLGLENRYDPGVLVDVAHENCYHAGDKHKQVVVDLGSENRYNPGLLFDLGHENRYHTSDKDKQVVVDLGLENHYDPGVLVDVGHENRYIPGDKKLLVVDVGDKQAVVHENRYNAGDNHYYFDVGDEHANSSTHAKEGRLLGVAGIMTASAAVTGLAAGTASSPAAAMALFALLLAGLSLILIHVRRGI